MFNLNGGPNQLLILNVAFSHLCRSGATEAERDRVQLVLFEIAQDGLTTVEALVARASDLLAIRQKTRRRRRS
ncbi:MAG: hypothetical protein Q8M31_23740 [Beijerinckiaceae bacterium]|nr:hypothetical protein [Beijerinckiaceae bacterium]